MARFHPLLPGPVIEAPDLKSAEVIAAQRHGREYIEVRSALELEELRGEREAGNRRRKSIRDEDEA